MCLGGVGLDHATNPKIAPSSASNMATVICYLLPRNHKISATENSPKLIQEYTPWVVLFTSASVSLCRRQGRVLGTPCSYREQGVRPSQFWLGQASRMPSLLPPLCYNSSCTDLILGIPSHTRLPSALFLGTVFYSVPSCELWRCHPQPPANQANTSLRGYG